MPKDIGGIVVETVGDIIENGSQAHSPPARFEPARLGTAPLFPEPGIHFFMPEETYHAIPALSSNGAKKLAASPMIYWASQTWLNPKPRKIADDAEWKVIGRAYHCRIFEPQRFAMCYAQALVREDFPDAPESTDDIKAAIVKAGGSPISSVDTGLTKVSEKTGKESPLMRPAKKEDLIAQLLALTPEAQVWDHVKAAHARENDGLILLDPEAWSEIQIAAAMIERDPALAKALTGGFSEVSLFWYCPRTGVPMKARADYLKIRAIVDLKTIANQQEMSMERAIAREIANKKYNVQPSVYFEGADQVRQVVRDKGASAITVWGIPPENTDMLEAIQAWTLKWAKHAEPDQFLFVFQQKGIAPVTRALWYPRAGTTKMVTDDIILSQKRRFREFSEAYGTDPWLDLAPIYDLNDDDIPSWSTEI